MTIIVERDWILNFIYQWASATRIVFKSLIQVIFLFIITAIGRNHTSEHLFKDALYNTATIKRKMSQTHDLFPLIPISVFLSEILMMLTKQWTRSMSKLRA